MTDKAHRQDHDKKKAPTAGPDYDDRGPDPQADQEAALKAAHIATAQDFKGRVLKTDIDGDGTKITFSGGFNQGVTIGMTGALMGKSGPYAQFEVQEVKDRYSTAHVKATPDEVHANSEVVINPSVKAPTKLTKDTSARILAYTIESDGLTRITFSAGEMQGVTWGAKGVVISESGRELADIEVNEIGPRFSRASVKLIPDQLHNAKVILGKTKS